MDDCNAIGEELADTLGIVYIAASNVLESFLDTSIDGFVLVRSGGCEVLKEGLKVRLFFFDHLPLITSIDSLRIKPSVYIVPSVVATRLDQGVYSDYYVVVGSGLHQVSSEVWLELYNASCIVVKDLACECDLFYL